MEIITIQSSVFEFMHCTQCDCSRKVVAIVKDEIEFLGKKTEVQLSLCQWHLNKYVVSQN